MQTQRVGWGASDIACCPSTSLGSRKLAKPISVCLFFIFLLLAIFLAYLMISRISSKPPNQGTKSHIQQGIPWLSRPSSKFDQSTAAKNGERLLWAVWRWLTSTVSMCCCGAKLIMEDFEFRISLISKICSCSFKVCGLNFSGSTNWLEIQWILHHACQQRLSNRTSAHLVHSTTSAPAWPQCDLTFLIWHFSSRLSCDVAISVSDFCFGGTDLESVMVVADAAHLGLSAAASTSSWPSLSHSWTWELWRSEFLHFCPIFYFLLRPLISQQNTSTHGIELKNRPPLVDVAHQGLLIALACTLCWPATAISSWRYLLISASNFQQLHFKV